VGVGEDVLVAVAVGVCVGVAVRVVVGVFVVVLVGGTGVIVAVAEGCIGVLVDSGAKVFEKLIMTLDNNAISTMALNLFISQSYLINCD
jgi:uncharacterized membrane protein YjjP (DUF1212 family)